MTRTPIKLRDVELRTQVIPLVRPFKFGMVELRELTHLRVMASFEIRLEGADRSVTVVGTAGENLAPKWFEKRAETTLEEDVRDLRRAVNRVVHVAMEMDGESTPFAWWWQLYREAEQAIPEVAGLVRQLGVSLLERAAIEAWCRVSGGTFHALLMSGSLGFEPTVVSAELKGDWRSGLPKDPTPAMPVRHTVGLGDDPGELPSLLAPTGIQRLKVKLSGNVAWDVDRVRAVDAAHPRAERITLDGNENYVDRDMLDAFLKEIAGTLGGAKVAWVEQALRRDVALSAAINDSANWSYPQVIDESDDSVSALPRALKLGYAGTTHKSCKGVFKSVLAATQLRGLKSGVLSGEDLTIVAPWSMAQDLAVAAAVGVIDIERNGHHYADGLAAFEPEVSRTALRVHPDLYEPDERGVARLKIRDGMLQLGSVNAAPLGWAG